MSVSWVIIKKRGLFGLYIRNYMAQGIPPEYEFFAEIEPDAAAYLVELGLAHDMFGTIKRELGVYAPPDSYGDKIGLSDIEDAAFTAGFHYNLMILEAGLQNQQALLDLFAEYEPKIKNDFTIEEIEILSKAKRILKDQQAKITKLFHNFDNDENPKSQTNPLQGQN